MTELVVLSGKGGTGKTSVTASLAALAEAPVLADCDVDASNLPLVLAPRIQHHGTFSSGLRARIQSSRCSVCGQTVGHIGIDLGGGLVAENASSGKRGLPMRAGTKISHLSEIGPSRLTGRYSLRVAAPAVDYSPGPIVVKVNDVAYLGEFDGSTAFLAGHEVRREAEAAGCVPPRGQVVAHFAETPRTVYVYGPWRVPAGAVRWVRE